VEASTQFTFKPTKTTALNGTLEIHERFLSYDF